MNLRNWLWRTSRALLLALLAVLVVKGGWFFSFRIHADQLLRDQERTDLVARREYLLARLESSFETESLAPDGDFIRSEWALGTLSMTTAALCNLALTYPDTRDDALERVTRLVDRALVPSTRAFDRQAWGEDPIDTLDGPAGHIGYLGHLNFMIGAWRVLGGKGRYEPLHRRITESLVRRMDRSACAHVETYPGQIFTADNSVVVASVAVFDRVSGADHQATVTRFSNYTRDHLMDPTTGLIVFNVDPSGQPLGMGRGCAAGWNSFYLPFFDEQLATQQFAALKKHMVQRLWLGVTGIREYPPGVHGWGDVDSGPVLFELSTSGTGFAIAGARRAGDTRLLQQLLDTAELVGFSVQGATGRRFLLAPLVGDAIMLAMMTARPWDSRYVAAMAIAAPSPAGSLSSVGSRFSPRLVAAWGDR
jgi:hypothetical protein